MLLRCAPFTICLIAGFSHLYVALKGAAYFKHCCVCLYYGNSFEANTDKIIKLKRTSFSVIKSSTRLKALIVGAPVFNGIVIIFILIIIDAIKVVN